MRIVFIIRLPVITHCITDHVLDEMTYFSALRMMCVVKQAAVEVRTDKSSSSPLSTDSEPFPVQSNSAESIESVRGTSSAHQW